MTVANWCVLIASILPILTVGSAKASSSGKPRREGGYDNHQPRSWTQSLSGWRARAVAAQQNGFEGLPLFIGAVAIAQGAHAAQDRIDQLAIAYIAARLIYTAVYLPDFASVRTLVWTLAFAINAAILFVR